MPWEFLNSLEHGAYCVLHRVSGMFALSTESLLGLLVLSAIPAWLWSVYNVLYTILAGFFFFHFWWMGSFISDMKRKIWLSPSAVNTRSACCFCAADEHRVWMCHVECLCKDPDFPEPLAFVSPKLPWGQCQWPSPRLWFPLQWGDFVVTGNKSVSTLGRNVCEGGFQKVLSIWQSSESCLVTILLCQKIALGSNKYSCAWWQFSISDLRLGWHELAASSHLL